MVKVIKLFFRQYLIVVMLLIFSVSMLAAEEKVRTNVVDSYASAVKLAAPAVVNIYMRAQHYRLGSGVIVDKNGYILTNHHLVQQASEILVALDDGRRVQANLMGSDPQTDLAVLKINLTDLVPVPIGNSDDLQVGDVVLAIGNPYGLGQTVTQGIISALGRNAIGINQLENYIQTDAAINPGNSGGALINTQGKLIGINTAIYTRSGGNQGIGFAIPVNVAMNVMHQIVKYGKVKRGWLGVEVRMLNPVYARSIGSKHVTGVVVTRVLPKSPAETAGLKSNDIIMSINQNRIVDVRGLSSIVAQLEPGVSITMAILRHNELQNVKIDIRSRPMQPLAKPKELPNHQQRHGNSTLSYNGRGFGIDLLGSNMTKWPPAFMTV